VRCGVSHRGEEGSICVLGVSSLSIRSGAEYARIAMKGVTTSYHNHFGADRVILHEWDPLEMA